MNLFNILASVNIFGQLDYDISLNFIGEFVGWLIKITGNAGLGIILFTVALRLIVLPFDIYSKIKTKKNAAKMEAMRPELERLQKQYANNKELYNQKMMALQKKNGYSPLSGCLPMILSLVIFIVAINAFRMYSAKAMKDEYNDIVTHYNAAVIDETLNGEDAALFTEADGEILVNTQLLIDQLDTYFADYSNVKALITKNGNDYVLNVGTVLDANQSAALDVIYGGLGEDIKGYLVKQEDGTYILSFGEETTEELKANVYLKCGNAVAEEIVKAYVEKEVKPGVNAAVKHAYESGEIKTSSFLWVKNIWIPDVSYENPVSADYKTFQSKISSAATKSCTCQSVQIPVDEATYNEVTAGLYEQKQQANGYFIMVALSIISMFLSQWIAQKSQKSQLELQSVDGQAAATQKMMMWMMPIMFGIFAFSYSTSFSIYMTVSSVLTTVSNILVNMYVEKKLGTGKTAQTEVRSKGQINKIEREREQAIKEAEMKKSEKKGFFKRK